MGLRPYQSKALSETWAAWADVRGVLLVAPTGSGKTVMGAAAVQRVVQGGGKVRWVAHRSELLSQAQAALGGHAWSTILAPGYKFDPSAQVVVTSVQTLLSRGDSMVRSGLLDEPALVVLDEAHHYGAAEWSAAGTAGRRVLGLTATPERSDGAPLRFFDRMVVAAHYSELVRDGYLVPARVFRPGEALRRGVAQSPLDAYRAHGEGGQAFVFAPTVAIAAQWAEDFTAAGFPAAVIEQGTPAEERRSIMARFRAGELRVLTNVYVLTEGVDVPAAQVCILGRGVQHVTPYLQMAGRVLRPAPDKAYGILIDLAGASHSHGLPTEDRSYSLEDGIKRSAEKQPALRVCIQCGMTYQSAAGACPSCGFRPEQREVKVEVHGIELAEAFGWLPDPVKRKHLDDLLEKRRRSSGAFELVVRSYQEVFGEAPDLRQVVSEAEQRAELERLMRLAKIKRYNPQWAAYRWRNLFGGFPPRKWMVGHEGRGREASR